MSLPTSKPSLQKSIRSFFHPKAPNYAPPPSNQTGVPAAPPPTSMTAAPGATTATGIPTSSPLAPLPSHSVSPHPKATVRSVTPADISSFRRINSLLLPVAYPDTFYASTLDPARSALFSRVITWRQDDGSEMVVGGIVCRIEPLTFSSPSTDAPSMQLFREFHAATGTQEEGSSQALYIQSLCLLSPYRSFGLASAALDQVLVAAARDPSLNVQVAYAHVWTQNEDGLRWYAARGFTKATNPVENYYFKLQPSSAWIVQRAATLPAIRGALAAVSAPQPAATPSSESPSIFQPTPVHVPQSTTAAVANPPPPDATVPPRGPPVSTSTPPARTASGQSYQNRRADMEWNDLPADMTGLRPPPNGSGASSGQSSRSSSAVRKKKERAYPAAAFGS
jgi:N-alpha-acetyltransferase 50